MNEKGYDWGGFLTVDPTDLNPPLSPSVFGKQLLAVADANAALALFGVGPGISLFTSLNFTGSNLTSIVSRSFYDLQNIPVSNLVYVDATNGHDSGGSIGLVHRADRPFLTLTAAKTAASSGDTIIVLPGDYNQTGIGKNGVNIQLSNGARIRPTSATTAVIGDSVSSVLITKFVGNIQHEASAQGVIDVGQWSDSAPFTFVTMDGNIVTTSGFVGSAIYAQNEATVAMRGDIIHAGSGPAAYLAIAHLILQGSISTTHDNSIGLYIVGGTARLLSDYVRTTGVSSPAIWAAAQDDAQTVDLKLSSNEISATSSSAIFWGGNARLDVNANFLSGKTIVTFGGFLDTEASSDMHLRGGELVATDAAATAIDWPSNDGINEPVTDQTLWVNADLLRCAGGVAAIRAQIDPDDFGARNHVKIYLTSQKALSSSGTALAVEDGKMWTNLDKLTASGVFLSLSGGESWHDIRLFEVGTTVAQFVVDCSNGTHVIKNARFIGGASNKGINVSGGTLVLENCYIDTSANSSTDAIAVSGGTVSLKGCTLKSHSSRKDINRSAGTVEVTNGRGTNADGTFTTSGTVNFVSTNLRKDANLSDLTDASIARTNLGLAALATTTPGTGVATALGANIGSPGALVINGGTNASGSNTAGSALLLSGGLGTGTGKGGDIVEKTGVAGSSGSTPNTATTRRYVSSAAVNLTESADTLIVNIALAAGKSLSADIHIVVYAGDGTDLQVANKTFQVLAVNKAGTITLATNTGGDFSNTSSGTLSYTPSAVANGNSVDIKVNALSSLTQTSLKCRWMITRMSTDDVGTVTPQ